jgi:hypothetical protein
MKAAAHVLKARHLACRLRACERLPFVFKRHVI